MYAAEGVSAVSQMWRSTYVQGEIEAIVIPRPGKICGFFGTDCEYVIPFPHKKIHPDIVLWRLKKKNFCKNFKACGIIIAHIEMERERRKCS